MEKCFPYADRNASHFAGLCIEDVRKNHYLVAICYTVLYMAKLLYCYSYWLKQSANS